MGIQSIPLTMRAWTIKSRGPPSSSLAFEKNIPTPKLSSSTSVLIRVSHVALHPGTSLLMHIIPMMFRSAPAVAETDFSGTIVAVGDAVPTEPPTTDAASNERPRYFPVGSKVFGSIPVSAHLKGSGSLSEYVAVEMNDVARVPEHISLEAASCLAVSGITALDVVDLANLKPGYRVLINAPCGGVGSIATQMIRHAVGVEGRIVGICSGQNVQLAKSFGCDDTVDYSTATDKSTAIERLSLMCAKGGQFDAIMDCHGSQELWLASDDLLKAGADHHYATVGPKFPSMSYAGMAAILWQMLVNSVTPVWAGGVPRSYKQAASFINAEKLERVRVLAEQDIIRPHVGSKFALEDALEAYEVLMSGHARGKVVIKVSGLGQ